MKKYDIHEKDRITRADSELFLGFAELLQGNADVREDYSLNKTVRDIFANHESEMGGLPFYWITRASASNKLEDFNDVRHCCESYFRLYGTTPIIRRDMDACAMALLYVATTMKDVEKKGGKINVEWVRSWLGFIENTVRIPEWQTKFCVAMIYRRIGDESKAIEVLYKTFLEVYACIKVWEKSLNTKNIFRTTPAMEKAYSDLVKKDEEIKKSLPDWEKDAEKLVPYSGYVWLSGALYASGRADIYDRFKVNLSKVGVSIKYITGRFRRHPPAMRNAGAGKYRVFLNGCADDDCGNDGVSVYGQDGKRYGVQEAFDWPDDSDVTLVIRTNHGILVRFTFKKSDPSIPANEEICFPWSMSK